LARYHAGHLVLLGLNNQDYPHCVRIEQWPTWDLPILRWGKSQGALVGFAHSGWGLEVKSRELPNYEIPPFDSIGANEYIVDVTYPDTVDFISAVDTPYTSELNIWYHALNVGFRTRISGETDFPCITYVRVGQGRVYAKVDGPLSYAAWLEALHSGRSYVSDGLSHLMDFSVNGVEVGTQGSEVKLTGAGTLHVRLKASAYLAPFAEGDESMVVDREPAGLISLNIPTLAAYYPGSNSVEKIQNRPLDQEPYWHVERGRIGNTREVSVELVMNGKPVAQKNLLADRAVQEIAFDAPVARSSWLAVRILGSSHTNPIFVLVDGKPIRASRQSAQWCLAGVNQCWTQKAPKISKAELPDAQAASMTMHARFIPSSSLNVNNEWDWGGPFPMIFPQSERSYPTYFRPSDRLNGSNWLVNAGYRRTLTASALSKFLENATPLTPMSGLQSSLASSR
jgi:hypothetical protein